MKEKSLGIVAVYDEGTQQRLQALQQTLRDAGFTGRQAPDVPFHVTLGIFPVSEKAFLLQRMEGVCRDTRPIPVRFNSIGLFGLDVLFLSPSVSVDLLALRSRFVTQEDLRWMAHTTLLMDKPENILKAVEIVAGQFEAFDGFLEAVHMYEIWPERLLARGVLGDCSA